MTHPRAIAVRSSLVILCATILHAARLAHGDLYTDGVLSLEWLVDSSDEIYLVQTGPPSANEQPTAKSLRVLKAHKDKTHLSEDRIRKEIWRWAGSARNLRPRENEDWLLFVRGTSIGGLFGSRHVFRGINLTRPLKSYDTAAVTREGKPLPDRQTILDAVKARVQLNRRLPPRADRRAVDRLAGTEGHPWKPEDEPGVASAYLRAHVGGTLIRINCNYWDQEGPNDVDTLLNRVVVPVEPEDHARLLEAARREPDSKQRPMYRYPIMALVNFPGEETEACLKEIIASWRPSLPDRRSTLAHAVLRFLVYHLEPTDPKNKTLTGRWRLEGQHEVIDFTFAGDQTFVASAFAGPKYEPPRTQHLWDGQGYWIVRDGKLSIMRTHAREGLRWRENSRELFRGKKIEAITPTAVVLEHGPPMKRR